MSPSPLWLNQKLLREGPPLPKLLCDVRGLELIYGPPVEIFGYRHFRDYQKWMAEIAMKQDVFLGAEMGLGKTAACLFAASVMLEMEVWKRVLIVAPLKVAEETWPEEIAKWDFARGLTYTVVTGDEPERIAALTRPAQIVIINRENLAWLQRWLRPSQWKFDCLIYDEASRLKRGAKRTNPKPRADGTVPPRQLTELGILRRHRHQFKRVIELSGTPAPNGLRDLWGPCYLIDDGERLGRSITKFEERWFRPAKSGYGVEPFEHAQGEIMSRISDIFYSLREEDYLKLPPLIPVDHEVSLTPKQMQAYRDFEREMAIEVINNQGDPEIIEAVNNGVLLNKLLQFANGSLYLDDNSAKKIHDHKLDVLESIMEEAAGKPVLVAYSFKFDEDAIRKRFPYVRVFGESREDKRDWDAGRIRMLLTHPASAGHGLNFQYSSNIAVWFGLTWSLELYRQFIKRLHRSGQKEERVFLHRIITRGTADLKVLRVLQARGVTQDAITDAVRVMLRNAARMAA